MEKSPINGKRAGFIVKEQRSRAAKRKKQRIKI